MAGQPRKEGRIEGAWAAVLKEAGLDDRREGTGTL